MLARSCNPFLRSTSSRAHQHSFTISNVCWRMRPALFGHDLHENAHCPKLFLFKHHPRNATHRILRVFSSNYSMSVIQL